MKFLLKLLVAIAALVGIVLIIALFVDGSFNVERSQTIPAEREIAFAFFKDLEHHEELNTWLKQDASTKVWYEGTPGEVGYKMCWKSERQQFGEGEQEIVAITDNERIDYKIRFHAPENLEADLSMIAESIGEEQTKISWQLTGEVPYPWNLALLFRDIEKEIGDQFEEGLQNAKPLVVQYNN